jgi:hypothetical protein
MNNRTGAVIAIALAAAIAAAMLVMRGGALGQQSRPESARASEFSGKTVLVETTNGFSVTLDEVRIKEVGGRTFVVGRAPRGLQDGNAYTGSTLWVPLNDITRMSEFETFQHWSDVQAALKKQSKAP